MNALKIRFRDEDQQHVLSYIHGELKLIQNIVIVFILLYLVCIACLELDKSCRDKKVLVSYCLRIMVR